MLRNISAWLIICQRSRGCGTVRDLSENVLTKREEKKYIEGGKNVHDL